MRAHAANFTLALALQMYALGLPLDHAAAARAVDQTAAAARAVDQTAAAAAAARAVAASKAGAAVASPSKGGAAVASPSGAGALFRSRLEEALRASPAGHRLDPFPFESRRWVAKEPL